LSNRRYRSGKSSRKRVMKEIKKTSLIMAGAIVILAGAIFLGIKGVSSLSGYDREAAQTALDSGMEYRAKRDPRTARIELKNAVQEDPEWPVTRIALAEVMLMLFDAANARDELLTVIELGVKPHEVGYLLGKAYWLVGDYDNAKKALTDPKIKLKDYANSQRILGRVLIETGDVDGSRAAFDRALEKAPKDSMLWTDIGRFRFILGDQKGAIEAVELAVALDEDNYRALEFRGRLIRSQFGLVAALPWFERALEIRPDDISILTEYAATLGDAGRATDMLEVTREILALDRRNGRAYFMQALIAARARHYKLASRLLKKAGERENNTPSGLLLSAIIEYEQENYNRSVSLFRKLLERQPNNQRVIKLLSSAHLKAGAYEDAYESISRFNDFQGGDTYSNILAARSLEALDKRSEAANYIDKASNGEKNSIALVNANAPFETLRKEAQKKPKRADIVIPYIRALLAKGNNGQALGLANNLLKNNPGVADAHILVGDVQIRNGNVKAALENFQNARSIQFEQPLMLRLVDALKRVGDQKAAREILLTYLSNNPRDLMAQKLVADVYMDLGDATQASFWLESIRDRIGYNDTILLTKLARTYATLEQYDKAVKTARQAYIIDPSSVDTTRVYGYVLMREGKDAKSAVELLSKSKKLLPNDKGIIAELKEAEELLEKQSKEE